ncbi:MAG: MFS transporter [Candidatus Odinarchaeota archaeon]
MHVNRNLTGLSTFQFMSFLRRAIFYAFFYVYLRTYLGLSNTLSALLGTMNMVGSTVGQLKIWGPRLNRQPEKAKPYVVRGEVIAGCVYFLVYMGHRFLVDYQMKIVAAFFMISLLSVLEVFWSMSDLGVRHLMARVTEKGDQRGRTIGMLDSFGLLGQVTGFLLSGILYQDGSGFYGGLIFFLVITFIFSCAAIIQLLFRGERPDGRVDLPPHINGKGVRSLLKNYQYATFMFSLLLLIIGINSSYQIFYYYVTNPEGLGFSDQLLSVLLITFTISGGLVTLLGGKISDIVGRIPVIAVSGAGASLSYLLFFFMGKQTFIIIAVVYGIQGACAALVLTIGFSHVADIVPEDLRGSGFAFFNVIAATGWGLAGFLVGGPVADTLIATGQTEPLAYRFSFLVSGMVILVGTISTVAFTKVKGSHRTPGTSLSDESVTLLDA